MSRVQPVDVWDDAFVLGVIVPPIESGLHSEALLFVEAFIKLLQASRADVPLDLRIMNSFLALNLGTSLFFLLIIVLLFLRITLF